MLSFITQLVFISSVALAQDAAQPKTSSNFDVDLDGQMKLTIPDDLP